MKTLICDIIGALALFGAGYGLLFLGMGMGL